MAQPGSPYNICTNSHFEVTERDRDEVQIRALPPQTPAQHALKSTNLGALLTSHHRRFLILFEALGARNRVTLQYAASCSSSTNSQASALLTQCIALSVQQFDLERLYRPGHILKSGLNHAVLSATASSKSAYIPVFICTCQGP